MRHFRQIQASRVCQNLVATLAVLGLLSSAASAQVAVSPAFTYQAQLKVAGVVLNGSADLQFTLFNAESGGAQVGTTQTALGVDVVNGLFDAQIDFGAAAYNGEARWVEIAVRSPAGGGTYTTLSPRQPLTATPYARYAVEAFNGGDQTVSSTLRGVLWTRSPNGTDVFLGGSTSGGIGLSSPASRLHVRAPFNAVDTARFDDNLSTSQLRIATPQSAGRAELQAWNLQTNAAGPLAFNVAGGNVGIGTNAPNSRLDVAGSFEADAFRLNGNGAAAGRILMSDASGNGSWQAAPAATQWITNGSNIGYTAGNVGVGITTPVNRLDVEGGLAVGSAFSGASAAPANGLIVEGRIGVGTATPHSNFQTQFAGGAGVWRGAIAGTGTTNAFVAGELSGIATIGGHNAALSAWADLAINPVVGNVGIGTTTPTEKLDVAGTIRSDALLADVVAAQSLDVSGTSHTIADIESSSTSGTWLSLRNFSAGGRFWQFISTGSGNGGGAGNLLIGNGTSPADHATAIAVQSDGDVGIGTLTPTAKLDVIGTARVQVLTITGGSDVAEPFNINSVCGKLDAAATPGMVVTIDPNRVGELKISGKAYDKTVAGIISGANGVNPGMVLTQEGSVADGKHPVALTGRVWCWCDADAGGAITAGDMLTTSDTPGHAMRVDDHDLAPGAVIGKAMSSLKNGKGLVLVLVSLQ